MVAIAKKKDNMLNIQKTSRKGCCRKPAYTSWLPFAYIAPKVIPKEVAAMLQKSQWRATMIPLVWYFMHPHTLAYPGRAHSHILKHQVVPRTIHECLCIDSQLPTTVQFCHTYSLF